MKSLQISQAFRIFAEYIFKLIKTNELCYHSKT